MSVVSILKKALGVEPAGADEAKLAALRTLGQANRAAQMLVENTARERLGQEHQQTVGGVGKMLGDMDPTPDPTFVGPRDSELGLPENPNQEAMPAIDFSALGVSGGDVDVAKNIGRTLRKTRHNAEEETQRKARNDEEFQRARTRYTEAGADLRGAQETKIEHPPAGGGRPSTARSSYQSFELGPDNQPIYGSTIVMTDGTTHFQPNAHGGRPMAGGDASQKDRDTIRGFNNNITNLDVVLHNMQQADMKGLLGPASGRLANFSVRYLGGMGLSEDDRALIQSIDRAKTMAAFESGGKNLTGTEKVFFDQNFPTLENTSDPKTFMRIAHELQAAFKRERDKAIDMVPVQKKPSLGSTSGGAPFDPDAWLRARGHK